ncbi:MAG: Rne/Rng family ribonuclease [Verrucomicrobiota bacterium]|nr:Rne/Rng family ribonuclease [Verrucomicrobiota bacterium]
MSIESVKESVKETVKKILSFGRVKTDREIIINVEKLEYRVALLEKGKLEEFSIERTTEQRIVGSIFKGKIKNHEIGLKAAFVDIGFEKNAFLHHWDMIPAALDEEMEQIDRNGRKKSRKRIEVKDIPNLYPPGSDVMIQVTKGPIGNKGPRVTTNISMPGRFLVLMPFSDACGISRKVEDPKERKRLRKILENMEIPSDMGLIMRTAGVGQKERFFVRDLAMLVETWSDIERKMKNLSSPNCLFREPDLIERTVRDFLTEEVDRIVIDSATESERIKDIMGRISKRSVNRVRHYADPQPIFEKFNIEKQISNAFNRQVSLKSGGYIIIDETEALVAIDVNTGKHKVGGQQDENALLNTNLEAVDEICRQLRLRNIGGLIVLDFIDMKGRRDQQSVFNRMRDNLRKDKAKTHILPISQLGLMEMTRQRHAESIQRAVYVECPSCKGRGVVKSPESISVELQRRVAQIMRQNEPGREYRIFVNPEILNRLRKEDEDLLVDLERKYAGKLSFRSDAGMPIEHFKITDSVTNEELLVYGA